MNTYLVCFINPFKHLQTFYRWNGIDKLDTKNNDNFMGMARTDIVAETMKEICQNWNMDTVILYGETTYIEPIVEELQEANLKVIIGEQTNELSD